MAIATAYETHRKAVFPGGGADRYVPDMPRSGPARMEHTMSKWIVVTASALAVVAVIMFLCLRFIGSAHAEPGGFVGTGGHKASGHVEIIKEGDVTKVVLKDDFTLQEAPAPRLAWGKDGYKRGTIFATLAKFKGTQEYTVPAGIDLSQFNEIWIWCEKFDVPLASAKLK
jgi:hypothetical protein